MKIVIEGQEDVLKKIARMKELTRELSDLAYSLMPLLQIEYTQENKQPDDTK